MVFIPPREGTPGPTPNPWPSWPILAHPDLDSIDRQWHRGVKARGPLLKGGSIAFISWTYLSTSTRSGPGRGYYCTLPPLKMKRSGLGVGDFATPS